MNFNEFLVVLHVGFSEEEGTIDIFAKRWYFLYFSFENCCNYVSNFNLFVAKILAAFKNKLFDTFLSLLTTSLL